MGGVWGAGNKGGGDGECLRQRVIENARKQLRHETGQGQRNHGERKGVGEKDDGLPLSTHLQQRRSSWTGQDRVIQRRGRGRTCSFQVRAVKTRGDCGEERTRIGGGGGAQGGRTRGAVRRDRLLATREQAGLTGSVPSFPPLVSPTLPTTHWLRCFHGRCVLPSLLPHLPPGRWGIPPLQGRRG